MSDPPERADAQRSTARLQQLVPDTVLVGGSAATTHVHHHDRAQEGEADVDRVLLMRVTVQEMEVGPPEPLCRGWFQTTACCVG